MVDVADSFGERLRKCRQRNNMTQKELADGINLYFNDIYDYLDINDLINFRLCCKDVYKIFNEKISTLNRFYLNIIKM